MKRFILLFSCIVIMTGISKAQVPADTVGAGNGLRLGDTLGSVVDLGDVYDSLTFPFTVEAWIDPFTMPYNAPATIFTTERGYVYCGVAFIILQGQFLDIRFGNGLGIGQDYRRGFYSPDSIHFNRWSHVAVVCRSVTDISMYINGVLQTLIDDGGTSTSTTIAHSNSDALIGDGQWAGNSGGGQFIGYVDEVKIWSDSLTQTTIRNNMCHKIDPNSPNLIGYWRMDEADTAKTVHDYSPGGINGTLLEKAVYVTSGAPIGNTSTYLYNSTWSGYSVKLGETKGDTLMADNISGSPYGVHVYAVNASPANDTGLQSHPGYYFGVFCAGNDTSPGYRVTYNYSLTDGFVVPANQNMLSVDARADATTSPWTALGGTLDTSAHTIIQTGQTNRGEYILNNFVSALGINQLTIDNGQLTIYPNPASNQLIVESGPLKVDKIEIKNVLGEDVYSTFAPRPSSLTTIDVSAFSAGMYFVSVTAGDEVLTKKVVVSR